MSCALCLSWFSRRHWCRASCRSVSPRVRNPSFLLVVVRPYLVIVSPNCSHNYCLLHVAKTGHLKCYLYNVRASTGSSYASLCTRRRSGRFRCGAQGVKSMARRASGTLGAGSWVGGTARLLMNPADVPIRCSPLKVSRPDQKPITHARLIGSWAARENLSTRW